MRRQDLTQGIFDNFAGGKIEIKDKNNKNYIVKGIINTVIINESEIMITVNSIEGNISYPSDQFIDECLSLNGVNLQVFMCLFEYFDQKITNDTTKKFVINSMEHNRILTLFTPDKK